MTSARATIRNNRELAGLILLFAIFLVSALFFERVAEERPADQEPSSFNAALPGVKALYLLFSNQGMDVRRLDTSFAALSPRTSMVVVVEPLSRDITPDELKSLKDWVNHGGTVLFLVTDPPRALDPRDPLFGDIAVEAASGKPVHATINPAGSPYLRDVRSLIVASKVRLRAAPDSGFQVLVRDRKGTVAVWKASGGGRLIAMTGVSPSNGTIGTGDSAVLFVNIAEVSQQNRRGLVLFDEYHHGVGFEERPADATGALAYLPSPARLVLWHLVVLGLLLIYNGNRRFGDSRRERSAGFRGRGEYFAAMAGLWRRAHAPDVAVVVLYRAFLHDARRVLDAPAGTPPQVLGERAAARFGLDPVAVASMVLQCEQIAAGARAHESASLALVREIDLCRRRFEVGRFH